MERDVKMLSACFARKFESYSRSAKRGGGEEGKREKKLQAGKQVLTDARSVVRGARARLALAPSSTESCSSLLPPLSSRTGSSSGRWPRGTPRRWGRGQLRMPSALLPCSAAPPKVFFYLSVPSETVFDERLVTTRAMKAGCEAMEAR